MRIGVRCVVHLLEAKPSPLFELRRKTRARHRVLDELMTARLEEDPQSAIDTLLEATAKVVPGLEQQLLEMTWPAELEVETRLVKTGWLRSDLGALPEPTHLALGDQARGWGCLYVLEGSTLGASAILARGGEYARRSRYLRGYGSSTGARWRRYVQLLETQLRRPQDVEGAATAAAATFDCFLGPLTS